MKNTHVDPAASRQDDTGAGGVKTPFYGKANIPFAVGVERIGGA